MLVALAITVAVVAGANDGGTLLAIGLRVPALSVPASLTVLVAAVVLGPWLIGTAVARTLLNQIVPAGPDRPTVLAAGFLAAVSVVAMLTWTGLPTSLTLAVIGGLTGAGVGWGLAVAWGSVLKVLAVGLAAPIAGLVVAAGLSQVLALCPPAAYLPTVRRAHIVAYCLQCLGYAVNDGQKMLVLFLAAGGAAAAAGPALAWWAYPAMAVAFAAGTILGLPKVARSMGSGILNTQPAQAVTVEFAAALAALGSATAGTPVSMTQSIAGGLVGVGIRTGHRRLRWHLVGNMAGAWMLTLPASAAAAAIAGLAVSAIRAG